MTDTDRSPLPKLAFGLNGVAPPDAEAVWGARFIYPDDMLYDRVDIAGSEQAKDALYAWLDGPSAPQSKLVPSRLSAARQEARLLADNGIMRESDDCLVMLYKDDAGQIVGNPRRSFGYLYVAAWLFPRRPEDEHYTVIQNGSAEERKISATLKQATTGFAPERWGVLHNGEQIDGGPL